MRLFIGKLVLALFVFPAWGEEAVTVLASIKPLALISRDLLGDLAAVDTLLPPNASPHDYALRVSDLQRLEQAQLVVWLGPELERFLVRPLARVPQSRVLALNRPSGNSVDPHGWLDPREASVYARRLRERFLALYPSKAEELHARWLRLEADYRALDQQLAVLLEPVRERGFVVYHRGYDAYVARYGLNQVGWITMTPEQPPGARHLYELEQRLAEAEAHCITDTAHPTSAASALAARFDLPMRALDLVGTAPAVTSYRTLMISLTRDLRACLVSAHPETVVSGWALMSAEMHPQNQSPK